MTVRTATIPTAHRATGQTSEGRPQTILFSTASQIKHVASASGVFAIDRPICTASIVGEPRTNIECCNFSAGGLTVPVS